AYSLWKSDGTTAGTTRVVQWTGASDPPSGLVNIYGKLYFIFFRERSYELWRSDGTPGGTFQVGDCGGRFDNGGYPTGANGQVYFAGNNTNLYRVTNGEQELVAGFRFGGPEITYLVNVNETLFLRVGDELWRLNGSGPAVKVRVLSFSPTTGFLAAAGKLYFAAREAGSAGPYTLWVSDGTYAGTKAVPGGAAGTPVDPVLLGAVNGQVYYSAETPALGRELWRHNPAQLPSGALRVNAGGALYKTGAGTTFTADNAFTGGKVTAYASGDIANTTDDELYRTGRFGETFSYKLPSGKGYFDVTLHFAETYWGRNGTTGAGSRKFNVDAEGQRRLTEYDIFAKAGGALRAVRETFTVQVNDGTLDLAFGKGSADLPRVEAIEVVPSAKTNRGPLLSGIPNELTGFVGQKVTFTAKGTDPDGDALKYGLTPDPSGDPVPAGAAIDPATGVFTWTPTQPGYYYFAVVVSDSGLPPMFDEAYTVIAVEAAPGAPAPLRINAGGNAF
ncbi:MAG TPA: malectin domain-containing carbohydrate-binding protein, partial [Cytophagales bacterium]